MLAGLLCVVAAVGASAQERADEFAYSVPLTLSGENALYQLEVPASVYEGVAHANLSDVRVFNGRGEIVPYAWKPRPAPGTQAAAWVELPFFPLRGSAGTSAEHLDVRAERSATGTIVRVISSHAATGSASALLGYLIDATAFKHPVHEIDLDWREPAAGLSATLHIEGSDDLQHWRTIVAAAPVVSLEFAGHKLIRKTVELPPAQYKYLRLTWAPGQDPLELTRLAGRPSDTMLEPARQWKAAPVRAGDKPGEYRFEAGGWMPVDRLRVTLPEPNTLVPVQVLARNSDDQPWTPVASGVLYRLTHSGREVSNADLSVGGLGRKQWLLRVETRGGGLGSGVPQIEVGWVSQQIVFVARGAGPFLLVYGNGQAKADDLPIQTLVPGWHSDAELPATSATAGAQQTLAGPRALQVLPNYKTWALWASLALGVVLLGWMVWVLAREIKGAGSKT